MALKQLTFYGKTSDELKRMSVAEFAQLIPARQRRTLKHGFSEEQKDFFEKLRAGKQLRTHCRDLVIVPEMLDKQIHVYDGKSFNKIVINVEMLGHRLGEFVQTRKSVKHSAPGIGATKSSAAMSVK